MHGAWGVETNRNGLIAITITELRSHESQRERKLLCIIMFEQILRQYIFIRSVGANFNVMRAVPKRIYPQHLCTMCECVLVFIIIL